MRRTLAQHGARGHLEDSLCRATHMLADLVRELDDLNLLRASCFVEAASTLIDEAKDLVAHGE